MSVLRKLQHKKTSNGKLTDNLAKTGAVVGGALLQMATGIPDILGANIGCHEPFKVRLGVGGYVREIRTY